MTDEQRVFAEDNHNLIYAFMHKYKLNVDDWYGILAVAYCKAVEHFKIEDGNKFSTYCFATLKNAYKQEIRRMNYQCRKGYDCRLNDELLDSGIEADCTTSATIDLVMDKLSNVEQKVFTKRLEGYSYRAIKKELGISDRKLNGAMNNIKTVLESELKLDDQ